MKILISGSSGLIGSCLYKKLSRDHEVFGLDLKRSPCTNVIGDILNYDLVKRLVGRVDIVVHCAAQTSVDKSVKDPLFDAQNNMIGTLNLLEAARRWKRLKLFIYLSSAAVYGYPKYVPIDEDHPCKPVSPYGVSKLVGELYAKVFNELYGVPTVCIRPFNVYGASTGLDFESSGVIYSFLDRLRKGMAPIIYGDGRQTRDFIHVQDVADMTSLVIENEDAIDETFNCGSGRETSIDELARLMLSIYGLDMEPKYAEARPGDIKRSCADMRKTERVIKFKSKISLEKGLKKLINSATKA